MELAYISWLPHPYTFIPSSVIHWMVLPTFTVGLPLLVAVPHGNISINVLTDTLRMYFTNLSGVVQVNQVDD
jgi:fructose-specific phosphotransferase system IIC component